MKIWTVADDVILDTILISYKHQTTLLLKEIADFNSLSRIPNIVGF